MSETQFVCDLCRQHYSTFEILMTHNRLRHYHTIKFGCGYCNETFRNEDDLYCHFVLTHHVDPYEARGPADRSRNASESDDGDGPEELLSPVVRRADETCPQMRLISESDDGSEYGVDGDGEEEDDGSESVDSDMELNYNELYMRRKRSAMTQEEISEMADVFKKTVQATYTTKCPWTAFITFLLWVDEWHAMLRLPSAFDDHGDDDDMIFLGKLPSVRARSLGNYKGDEEECVTERTLCKEEECPRSGVLSDGNVS